MTAYFFSTINPAEALAYNAATDSLTFESVTALNVRAVITASDVTLSADGARTVVFGLGMLGEHDFVFRFGSSKLTIGTSASEQISAGFFGDAIFGGDGSDTIGGGADRNVLNGGAGADVITLGGGPVIVVAFDPGQSLVTAFDVITDWSDTCTLEFNGLSAKRGIYVETQAATLADATTTANQQIASGAADYVAVQVGSNVYLYADDRDDNGVADDMVKLTGGSLAKVSASSIAHAVQGADPPPPTLPPSVGGASGHFTGNMDIVHLSHLLGASIDDATSTHLSLSGQDAGLGLLGTGFTYDGHEQLLDGTVTRIILFDSDRLTGSDFNGDLTVSGISAAPFGGWVSADATAMAFATVLAGRDTIGGSSGADLIRGYDGDDVLYGTGGQDTVYGGAGDDTIYAAFLPPQSGFLVVGSTYLRGDDGADSIIGGSGFDDINGNMGNDTAHGGEGDDWVVGGKDQDLLYGETGNDIVYGNLGDDTCDGGMGADVVRGGQGNDVMTGGDGNDWLSGDRGDDTISGGAGADVFHTFSEAGLDRVTDFSAAQGDRVQFDLGTSYTVAQSGLDTVISMSGGAQMILVGVAMSSLTGTWIFGA